jgi:hypothetical protein
MHIHDARGNLVNLRLVREYEGVQDTPEGHWTLYAVFDRDHRVPFRHYATAEEGRAGVERLQEQLNAGCPPRVSLD